MSVDSIDDLALFGLGVWGDGEPWAHGGVDGFGGWCAREWDGRWVDEGDGGGRELGSDRFCGNGGSDVIDGGVSLSGRGHVGMA